MSTGRVLAVWYCWLSLIDGPNVSVIISKFVFSKKATEIEKKIFIDNLTVCSKCQIDDEELAEFCGLLRKHEL